MPGTWPGAIAQVVAAWKARPDTTSAGALALKAHLMCHWVNAEVVRLLQVRAGVLRSQGSSGPEGSLGKLAVSVAGRRLAEWAPALLGPGRGCCWRRVMTRDRRNAGGQAMGRARA